MEEEAILRYTFIKDRPWAAELKPEGEENGNNEEVRKGEGGESSSEGSLKEDRNRKNCQEDGGREGRKQVHLRRVRTRRNRRHSLRLRRDGSPYLLRKADEDKEIVSRHLRPAEASPAAAYETPDKTVSCCLVRRIFIEG